MIFKILLLLLLPFYSTFGLSQIGVSIHDTTLVVGDIGFIPVYVDSSLTGENVTAFNLQLDYNENYLLIDSVITDGTITAGWGTVTYNAQPGLINIAGASAGDLEGKGIFLLLRYRIIRSGGTYLSFTDTLNNFFNEGSPRMITNRGYLRLDPKPSIRVSPNSVILTVGETKQFSVYDGAGPYEWSVTDNSVATIDGTGLLLGTQKGFTKVVCRDASSGITDTSDGFVEVRAFRLTIRDTSYYQGNIVDIPIYTTDLTGLGYTSGEISIHLDADILTPIELITDGTLLSGYSAPQFSFRDDVLNIGFAGTTPLNGSGILLKVRFQISSINTGSTYLSFNEILFNETDLGNGERAYFDVLPLASLSISPNTAELVAGDTRIFTALNGTPPYTWSVSNPTLATIDNTGTLTAIKGGVVTVNAMDVYGGTGTSGNIYLYDTEVTVPDTTLEIGGTIDLPLRMGNLSSTYSIVSLQTEVTFDSSIIKFDQVVTGSTSTNGWSFSVNNTGNKVVIAGANATGFNSAGTIVLLRFNAAEEVTEGRRSNVNLENFMFNEGSPNAKINNGRITIVSGGIPNAPTNLTAVAVDSQSVELTWNDNSGNESGFSLFRSLSLTSGWSEVQTVSANITSFIDVGLTDGTKYYYKVKAYSSADSSAFSNIDSAVTYLSRPTNLTGSSLGLNNLSLSWADNSLSEVGFIIERHEHDNLFYALDTVSANVTSYTDTNLTYSETYTYRVKAFNEMVESEYSNNFDYSVGNPFPAAPSNLIAATVDTSSINLTWTDNSDNEDGFSVYRSIVLNSGWAFIADLSQNTTSYVDNDLIDGTKYFYKVNAYNAAGSSEFSNIDSAITEMNSPTDLTAESPEGNLVLLNWVDHSQNELGFIIERHEGPNTGSSMLFSVIDTVGSNVTTYADSSFGTDSEYVYIVKAFNDYTESGYSNMASVVLVKVDEDNWNVIKFNLDQNYPNPFNPSTKIKYSVPSIEASQPVVLKIYDVLGKEVGTLVNKEQAPGNYEVTFDANSVEGGLSSGIYFYRLKVGKLVEIKKMVLMK